MVIAPTPEATTAAPVSSDTEPIREITSDTPPVIFETPGNSVIASLFSRVFPVIVLNLVLSSIIAFIVELVIDFYISIVMSMA